MYQTAISEQQKREIKINFNIKDSVLSIKSKYKNSENNEIMNNLNFNNVKPKPFLLNDNYYYYENSTDIPTAVIKNYDNLPLQSKGDSMFFAYFVYTFIDSSLWSHSEFDDNIWQQRTMLNRMYEIDYKSETFKLGLERVKNSLFWNPYYVTEYFWFENLLKLLNSSDEISNNYIMYQLRTMLKPLVKEALTKEFKKLGIGSSMYDVLQLTTLMMEWKNQNCTLISDHSIGSKFINLSGDYVDEKNLMN